MKTTIDILEGNRFVVSDQRGDIDGTPVEPHGFFANDTRFLSQWILTVNGDRPACLSVDTTKYNAAQFFLAPSTGTTYIDASLVVLRRRVVVQGFRETITVMNFGKDPATVNIDLAAAADFADLFEVKDAAVDRKRGESSVDADTNRLAFRYQREAFVRSTVVTATAAEVSYSNEGLHLSISLPPQGEWTTDIDVIALDNDVAVPSPAARDQQFQDPASRLALRTWAAKAPALESNWKPLPRIYEASMRDLASLRFSGPIRQEQALPAAGLPWFMTMFGRDSLITSLQALPFAPELAQAALLTLADFQARTIDPFRDAEPGKILHEMRFGELTAFEERPHSPYYGSADATTLFLILLDEFERWTGRTDVIRQLEPAARAALAWIDMYGDSDGDGYIEYERRNGETGLENQCWKDSWNSIQWADGRLADLPRATCELQGYAYDAKRRGARLARLVWDDQKLATELEHTADTLKDRFNNDFWLADRGYFAVALDGHKQPVDALTSNIGHLLWSGIVNDDKVGSVVEHPRSDRLFSGWGFRTFATDQTGYNPIGYHVGTVWPHDTAIGVLGLRRAGHRAEAARVAVALLEAAEMFDARLPEAFAGFDRNATGFPVEYPTACSPQAWASGAPLMLLRALMGLEPDGEVLRSDPELTDPIRSLALDGIPGRWGTAQAAIEASNGIFRESTAVGADVDQLIARVDATRTRGTHAVYRFDVDSTRRYFIVDDGRIVLADSGPPADCTLEMSATVLRAVARGEMNLNTAVMSGRIKVHGDIALVLRLRDMVDAAPAAQGVMP